MACDHTMIVGDPLTEKKKYIDVGHEIKTLEAGGWVHTP